MDAGGWLCNSTNIHHVTEPYSMAKMVDFMLHIFSYNKKVIIVIKIYFRKLETTERHKEENTDHLNFHH